MVLVMLKRIEQKKNQLDVKRPMPANLLANLERWFDLELTYTSNALEGNTLTRRETAVVLEKGITIGGKTLREHLEIINHEKAINFMKELIDQRGITETQALELHALILEGIDNPNAGKYRDVAVRISGSATILPNPQKVPYLMDKFFKNIVNNNNQHPLTRAALAHYELVTIHPFIDGNGRSARLLMNLILLQNGYPAAIIRPSDRLRYLKLLEDGQTGGLIEPFLNFIYQSVERSLDIYLRALQGDVVGVEFSKKPKNYLSVGELSKITNESIASIRFWTQKQLLSTVGTTSAGYVMYSPQAATQIKKIRDLQKNQRLSLDEIKCLFEKS